MTTFSDNFTGTDGQTIQSRTGWTRSTGSVTGNNATILSNAVVCPGGDVVLYCAPDPGSADQYAQADITAADITTHFKYARVVVRSSATARTFYAFEWFPDTAVWQITKMVGGNPEGVLASTAAGPPSSGVPFTLQLRVSGSVTPTLTGFLNGTQILTGTDTNADGNGVLTTGFPGFYMEDGSTTLDNFSSGTLADLNPPVTATEIRITTGPGASYHVGDTINIVGAATDNTGAVQTNLNSGAVKLRARSAPTGWDLTTVVDSDTWLNGVAALSFQVPMAGTWTFGLDDDSNTLTDSAASSSTTVTLATGTGALFLGDNMDKGMVASASVKQRTLRFRALSSSGTPVTGLTGKAQISINGAAAAASTNDIAELADGYYNLELAAEELAAVDDTVQLFPWSTIQYFSGQTLAIVTATDLSVAPETGSQIATDVRTNLATELGRIDAPVSGVPAATLDLADAVETGITVRGILRLIGAALLGTGAGLDTGNVTYKGAGIGNTKTRITATGDASGNRTPSALDVT